MTVAACRSDPFVLRFTLRRLRTSFGGNDKFLMVSLAPAVSVCSETWERPERSKRSGRLIPFLRVCLAAPAIHLRVTTSYHPYDWHTNAHNQSTIFSMSPIWAVSKGVWV